MLTTEQIKQAAQLLLQAEREVKPVRQLDETFPGIEIADSYAIQKEVIAAKIAAGARLRGHKIGLTSRAMQSIQGIDEPDYGHLDRKSTRLNSSHVKISYAVFCL